jgi:hypothetical protein
MFNDKLSDYVEDVAAKYLSAVDTKKDKRSNQHEIGGLIRAGFGKYLGQGSSNFHYRVRQIYVTDEMEEPVICDGHVTWYDVRRDDESRGPEYRLYYYDSPVTELMGAGDFFLIAKLKNELPLLASTIEMGGEEFRPGSFLMIFAPENSTIEHQLRTIFGLNDLENTFKAGKLDTVDLLLPLRSMLETLGVETGAGISQEDTWLDKLIEAFGGKEFPKTSDFSEFARKSINHEISLLDSPDAALMGWMEREESLFKIYEHHLVRARLAEGFDEDVEAFISFSLSVQNRRKSRAGHAFEGHLDYLFRRHGLQFQQGRGKGMVTEHNSKPDFIFPSFAAYHDKNFPESELRMLGAKTTCKDRWRQVLSEAKRIGSKHLVTLEAAISGVQLEEMQSNRLQLVIPASIHVTYTPEQRATLMDVDGFIRQVREVQQR